MVLVEAVVEQRDRVAVAQARDDQRLFAKALDELFARALRDLEYLQSDPFTGVSPIGQEDVREVAGRQLALDHVATSEELTRSVWCRELAHVCLLLVHALLG